MNIFVFALGIVYPTLNLSSPDTIILDAGKNSKVIFYGKSATDLKKLETIDLNKILKELNAAQTSAPETEKQHLTLESQEYLTRPAIPTRKQRFLANTFLNLHLGVGYNINKYTFFEASPAAMNHPTGRLVNDIALVNLMTSSLSVVHNSKLIDQPKYALSLRYGAGIGLSIQRYVHWTTILPVPNEDLKQVTARAKDILKANEILPLKSDFNAFQSYVQLTPSVSLKNRKGISTFYLNAGLRLNYNRNFENASPSLYSNAILINNPSGPIAAEDKGPLASGGGYGVYGKRHTLRLSYVAEIGYKWIGLFVLYYPNYVPLTTRSLNVTDPKTAGFTPGKTGNLGYVSIGIKLGR